MDLVVSYSISFGVIFMFVVFSFVVIDDMEIILCYYGDMNDFNECWDVCIFGQIFVNQGVFGLMIFVGFFCCIDYIVSVANVFSDLSDGDIDIQYFNFEAGWVIGDVFNVCIDEVCFEYDLDLLVVFISDCCQDGVDFNVMGIFFINLVNVIFVGILVGYFIIFNLGSGVFNMVIGVFDVL